MKKSRFGTLSLIFVFFCSINVFAQNIPVKKVLFFGIMEKGSPAFNETFDYMFRSRISSQAGISVIDFKRTQAYREKIEFSRHQSMSTGLISRLQNILPDSLLLIWGRIVSADVQPKRKKVFHTVFAGKASVAITIYNPDLRTYEFNGVISKEKEFIGPKLYFGAVRKSVTVSAVQRTKIINELLDAIAAQSTSLISSLLQNNQSISIDPIQTETKVDGDPSISDVFSVPSVEPAQINENTGGNKR